MRKRRTDRPPPRLAAALSLLTLLATLAAAPVQAQTTALLPPQAALDVLPDAVALAIAEARDHLLSDQAQARLEAARGFVTGFDALPPGQGALSDPQVRAAYAWTEDVVTTSLAIPPQLDALQTAGADCGAYFANVTRSEGQRTVALGLNAHGRLRAAFADLERQADQVPVGLDGQPLHRAIDLLRDLLDADGQAIATCLLELAQALAIVTPSLDALLLPDLAYRTARVRVLGTTTETGPVSLTSPAFAAGQLAVTGGTFAGSFQVLRGAPLGNNSVHLRAGDLALTLTLEVRKAPVTLHVDAPRQVASNSNVTLRVTLHSPLGSTEIDRVGATTQWRGSTTRLTLQAGTATWTVAAGTPGRFPLAVQFAGNDVLLPASLEQAIAVLTPDELAAAAAPAPPPPRLDALRPAPGAVTWWVAALLLAVLFVVILLLIPVWLHRARGWRSDVLDRKPGPLPWAGATGLVDAWATLFGLLHRRLLAPPGRTVREWVQANHGPATLADAFDDVRYGARAETPTRVGASLDWIRRQWQRWQA